MKSNCKDTEFAKMPKFVEYNYEKLDQNKQFFVNILKNCNLNNEKSTQQLNERYSAAIANSPLGRIFTIPKEISDIIIKQYCDYNIKDVLAKHPELFWVSWNHGEIVDCYSDDDTETKDSNNTGQYSYRYTFKDGSYFIIFGSSIEYYDDDDSGANEWTEYGYNKCGELKSTFESMSHITHITRYSDGVFTRHKNGKFGKVYFYQEWNFYNNDQDAKNPHKEAFCKHDARDINGLALFESEEA